MLENSYNFLNHGNELIEIIQGKLGNKFSPTYNKSGVTFFGAKGRILKMVNNSGWLFIEFNVPVPTVADLTVLKENEAREKHMGTCRWFYKGNSLDTVLELIGAAVEKY